MKRRIAKKVLNNYKCNYSAVQWVKAHRRLGIPLSGRRRIGVDMAVEGSTDSTFHHRTGKAPTTPGVIPPTSVVSYDDMTLTDLKDATKAKGLKGYSTMKKAELVALLKGE